MDHLENILRKLSLKKNKQDLKAPCVLAWNLKPPSFIETPENLGKNSTGPFHGPGFFPPTLGPSAAERSGACMLCCSSCLQAWVMCLPVGYTGVMKYNTNQNNALFLGEIPPHHPTCALEMIPLKWINRNVEPPQKKVTPFCSGPNASARVVGSWRDVHFRDGFLFHNH